MSAPGWRTNIRTTRERLAKSKAELDAGTAPPHARHHLAEYFRVGGGRLVGLADVDVDERGAGLERFLRRFDLLGRRDRHGRVVALARQRAGDRDGNDYGPHDATTNSVGPD